MKKVELQKVLGGLAVASIIGLAACNNKDAQNQQSSTSSSEIQASTSSHEMKIENVNEETGSFDIVDARTKKVLSYNKIMINNQNVLSTKCFMGIVIFYYDKVSPAGKEIANIGFPAEAPHGYELTAGILNIVVDNPPEASDNATVKVKEEKPTIKFKGGTCVYKSVDYSSEEKRFSVILHYTLDENASTTALTELDKGVIETSEGKTYELKERFSNSEYSLYKLDYHFPDAIRQGMSFKYVLNGQEIPISFF